MQLNRLLVLTLGALSLAVSQLTVAAAGSSVTPLMILIQQDSAFFSPNGDGRYDQTTMRFRLTQDASVTVLVAPNTAKKKVLHRESLGHLAAGAHVWRWNGKRGGKAVPDGNFNVVFIAQSGARTQRTRTYVEVDTDGSGRLITSRTTVYPLATVVRDRIDFSYVTREWYPDGDEFEAGRQETTRLSILNDGRTAVWRSTRKGAYTPHFSWDGRDQDGNILSPGDYVAVLKTTDQAGNRDKDSVPLTVSASQLEQKIWTTTISAAAALAYTPGYGGCNGCGDFIAPVPSERFPGGLSFRPSSERHAAGHFTIALPFPAAPIDTYRVSAFGGPTTPGSTDIGTLSCCNGSDSQTPVGDGTTATPWGPVSVRDEPFLPTGTQPVRWYFAGLPAAAILSQSYDVASFTIDYNYYAPVG